MTTDDSRMEELEELLEQEKLKNSNLTSKFEIAENCLKQQSDSNAQLNIQLKEKESVIEILRSSHNRSLDHEETDPVLIEKVTLEESSEIPFENNEFLKMMTEKICPNDLNEDTLNLKDDVVSELAESLPKIG